MVDSDNYYSGEAVFKHATDKAILVAFDRTEEHWVPRSCLSWKCDQMIKTLNRGDTFELTVRDWFAEQIGFD